MNLRRQIANKVLNFEKFIFSKRDSDDNFSFFSSQLKIECTMMKLNKNKTNAFLPLIEQKFVKIEKLQLKEFDEF